LRKEADAISYENRSACAYTKGHIKEQGKSVDSLQSEVDTQERKAEKLANTLAAALKRIEHLEQELKRPSVVEFKKTMEDNISELSSITEEKIKPIITIQELTARISYMNGLAGNINNKTLAAHCKSIGQDLPKLAMYAVDLPTYQLIRAIFSGTRSVESPGHPGGRDDISNQSAPPV
jgi:predicted RNase H-like nuclease (RuvC/YqgF family)